MHKDYFEIEGLSGAKKIAGTISVNGSKNAVLPAMAMAILFNGKLEILNVPETEDVNRMSELLELLCATIERGDGRLVIDSGRVDKTELDREISKRFRASIVLIGPLLARFGKVTFPHPGGCVIGERPIDLFLKGFQKMGASLSEDEVNYNLSVKDHSLHGAEIVFDKQSVTATETFMLAGALAKGQTILRNAAEEPEITTLAEFLAKSGVKISGIGSSTLTIEGTDLQNLKPAGPFEVIPDRIEAGSFLILGAMLADNLLITNCRPDHLAVPIEVLRGAGADIEVGSGFIRVKAAKKNVCTAISVKTHEYPGFPTDLQAPLSVFMTQCCAEGLIFETIFEGRLNYTADLIRMGADIKMWDAHHVTIKGPTPLKAKELEGPDIRAGIAFIMAAIAAEGTSIIRNAYYIDRGYANIEERLNKIGASIKRIRAD